MSEHFRHINDIQERLQLINRKKDVVKEKVYFRDGIRWIRVEEYGYYSFKETYDEMTPFKKVNIMKKSSRPEKFDVGRVGRKYGTISQEKKANLKEQVKFVKPEYRYFYESILG